MWAFACRSGIAFASVVLQSYLMISINHAESSKLTIPRDFARGLTVALRLAVVASSIAALSVVAPPTAGAAVAGASRYVAAGPARLADTRTPQTGGYSQIDGATVRVPVTGRGSVPAGAVAAVLTITATDSTASGFVSVWPTGVARPSTSVLNYNGAGATVANTTIVQLGNGSVDIYIVGGAKVIVDVAGAFVPTSGPVTSGRFQSLGAGSRVLDTRTNNSAVAAQSTTRIARPASIPADATAVAANITVDVARSGGFWTAWPAGASRPNSSVLNIERSGQTRSAMTIVPVTASGFDVFSLGGGHLIVDVVGYFTGPSAASSEDGLFVPMPPSRKLDTREPTPVGRQAPLVATESIEFTSPVSGASALVYNLTTTGAAGAGFVTAYPAGNTRPGTSNVNAPQASYTVANLAITTVSTRGVALYSLSGEHLVVDITGYFTGSAITAPLAPPSPPSPPTPPPSPTPSGCIAGDISRLNEVRAAAGAAAVVQDPVALQYACDWSAHMASIRSMVHSTGSPAGSCASGENIAWGSAGIDLFSLWVKSPGHYANMVRSTYTHAAYAYVTVNGETWATMILRKPC